MTSHLRRSERIRKRHNPPDVPNPRISFLNEDSVEEVADVDRYAEDRAQNDEDHDSSEPDNPGAATLPFVPTKPPFPGLIRRKSPPVTHPRPKMDASTNRPTRSSVDPLVKRDLLNSKASAPFYVWLKVVLRLPRPTLDEWVAMIRAQKWFEDRIIQDSFVYYCSALKEEYRYTPFITIANRILQLARGSIPGVPATGSYPMDDICYVNSSSSVVRTVPEKNSEESVSMPCFMLVTG